MTTRLQIRSLGAVDLDGVIAVAKSVDHAPHWTRSDYETALDPQSAVPRLCLAATLPDHPVAGFVIASVVPPQSEIEFIIVDPRLQRFGIATALLNAALDELQRRNIDEVLLEVRASNLPAQGLYRASGFVESGLRRAYYVNPVEDALLFSMQI